MSRLLLGCASAVLLLCTLFWDELAQLSGLSTVCPVLMIQGAPISAVSTAANAVGARWALPTYSRQQLKSYVGKSQAEPILLAMNGDVFDVSAGRRFYGPDSGYKLFAGVDATRSLSLGSLDPEDAAPPKWNDLRDFSSKPGAWDTLLEQHAFYSSKYGRVGRLVEGDGSEAVYLLPDGSAHRGPLSAQDVDAQRNAMQSEQASEL